MKDNNLKKDLGIFIATALVAGNMMGSGIFMLPATLAGKAGPGSIMIAWILTSLGSILIALSFAKLGSKIPKTGGPYEYVKTAFGDFMGFICAWLYWNGSWIGNAAVIIAVGSYTGSLIPEISSNPFYGFLFTSAILWIFTIINVLGVRLAGKIQTVITVFEILLFLFFIVVAGSHFDVKNITPLFPEGKGLGTVSVAATATLWSFIGLESSTIAAGEIRNPEKNVRRSTIFGILIAALLYISINIFAMGAMPQDKLAASSAPIADILAQYFGTGVARFITIGAVVSILGTTVGWLLSTARVAYAAAEDGMFPSFMGKIHPKFKTPHVAIIIGSVLVNILLFMNYNDGFAKAFAFITLLATLSFLPVYGLTVAAEIALLKKEGGAASVWSFVKSYSIPLIAFAYTLWTIYGSGAETVMYGFLLMMGGIPFYLYQQHKKNNTTVTVDISEGLGQ